METNSKYIKAYKISVKAPIEILETFPEWRRYINNDNIFLFNNKINKEFGFNYKCEIYYDNKKFITSEGLYQYLAFINNNDIKEKFCMHKNNLFDKIYGNENYINKDDKFWNNRFDCFLLSLLLKVQQNDKLQKLLLNTKDKILIENVYWNTKPNNGYFGCRYNETTNTYDGFNLHGRLLMKIRKYLQENILNEKIEEFLTYFNNYYFAN